MTAEETGAAIKAQLQAVFELRHERLLDPSLGQRVMAIKAYQHRRFSQSYADLASQARYAAAVQFFMEDLYGPTEFVDRDRQFLRIVPAMVRLFPGEILSTVQALGELHALSEGLDSQMGRSLEGQGVTGAEYTRLWRLTANHDRERQIVLMLQVGGDLDRYTRRVVLRQSLRLMRRPAKVAGLSQLQGFLEKGFDTFRAMGGAEEFLATIGSRERALAAALFSGQEAPQV